MKKTLIFAGFVGMIILFLSLPAKAQYLPDDYTMGLWHLDNNALDSTDYNNDGILMHTPAFVDGVFGQALSVDGTNYVRIPSDLPLNISVGTWEALIKCDILPSDSGHLMNPLAKQEQYWIHLSDGTHTPYLRDSIQVKVNVGGNRFIASTDADFIETGTWYHVMGTYDGDTLELYVNGDLEATNTNPSGPIQVTSYDLAIGTWSSPTDYFIGKVDEVRISNVIRAPFLPIDIDIKPGSDPNCFKPDGHGVIPVAILGSASFDVSIIDPFTVLMDGQAARVKGKSGNAGSLEDVNGDGFMDLVVQIVDEIGTYAPGDSEATVSAYSYDSVYFEGKDSICIRW